MPSSPYLSDELLSRRIAESAYSFALLTNIPITSGHALVIPKREVATMRELSNVEKLDLLQLVDQVEEMLRTKLGALGFNHGWNEGADFGQSIPHLHLHVVPRTQGDEGITEYEPRKFLYRPGSREPSPEAELAKLAAILRDS